MFISYNKNLIVNIISDTPIETDQKIKTVPEQNISIGKRMPCDIISKEDYTKKEIKELRVAFICNWNDNCGISTYSKYLCDEIKLQVKELKIFSEINDGITEGYNVEKCWERGKCLIGLIKKIKEFGPDYVIIQHEFGIFPNSFYFSQLCQHLNEIPYVIQTHSVYRHLDKICYTQCIKNIVVHTENQKDVYREIGNTSNIFVVPHGCVIYEDTSELWNINLNPYTIVLSGFPNKYKGLPRALEAISILKKNDQKFKKIFFTYLMSDTGRNHSGDQNYYDEIMELVVKLDLEENVAIIRKYQSEKSLCLFYRLNKLAIFPYINNSENVVFSASGSARIAMANMIPVIVSESHLFDDLQTILPRPDSAEKLAIEIDKVFSDGKYRTELIDNSNTFINKNNWKVCATKYLEIYNQLVPIS
jgi:glycosyltransferase involved in cell wall biosynthesis